MAEEGRASAVLELAQQDVETLQRDGITGKKGGIFARVCGAGARGHADGVLEKHAAGTPLNC
jgi:hypothetical protein